MTLPSTIPNQEPAPTSPATSSPQETSAPVPAPSPDEFSSRGADVEGAVADMMGLMDSDDELSPSQLREQAAAATPAPPATPAVATPAVVTPSPPSEGLAPPPIDPVREVTPPPATPTPVTAAPTVEPPVPASVPAPVVDPAVGAPAVPQPGVAPVPAPTPGEPTPGIGEGNPFAQLGQAVRANRSALETQLASQIKFSQEDVQEFHEAPEKFLPKLVAKIQLDMVENTFGVMAQQIPVAVSGVMALERQNVKYEDAFYNRWPQLKRGNPQHESVIMQIGRAYVQANPKADLQTRMTHIGAQAVVALNLLPSVTAPAAPAPAVVAPVPAFSPAGNGSGAPAPTQKQLEGWELFDQQFGNFDT